MAPKKKKGKRSEELTTDEVMKKLFPKDVLKELKRIVHGKDPKSKNKPSSQQDL
jgi:hypothetical protein